MISLAVSSVRQHFLARFELRSENYLYCRTPAALPVRISAKDRQFMVDAFERDWARFPYVVALAFACATLFTWISLSRIGLPNSHLLEDIAVPFSALWFVAAWYADLWDIPDRALFQRARDMDRLASLSWLTKAASDFSWKSTTIFMFWGPQFAYRALAEESADFWDKFFFGLMIFGATMTLLAAFRKVQLTRSRSLPYLNEVD